MIYVCYSKHFPIGEIEFLQAGMTLITRAPQSFRYDLGYAAVLDREKETQPI